MKRGYIFLLAILLIMPFAFAGQVSDFFSYFTNDVFSLITGAPIADLGGSNIQNDWAGISERANNPPATANKANGATCTAPSQCKSKTCTKVSNQKSICGKTAKQKCSNKLECFSDSCINRKCGLSPLEKSCIKTSDCVNKLS